MLIVDGKGISRPKNHYCYLNRIQPGLLHHQHSCRTEPRWWWRDPTHSSFMVSIHQKQWQRCRDLGFILNCFDCKGIMGGRWEALGWRNPTPSSVVGKRLSAADRMFPAEGQRTPTTFFFRKRERRDISMDGELRMNVGWGCFLSFILVKSKWASIRGNPLHLHY